MNGNMSSGNAKNEICAVCKSVAQHRCSGCKKVYYCSQEHQKSDWKLHSKICRVCKMVKDPTIGRHYVATRKIEIGEIVICDDSPLLVIPNTEIHLACLSCYIRLTVDSIKPCYYCGWPLCADCTEHGPECQLTLKYRKSKIIFDEYSEAIQFVLFTNAISVMRALSLRDENPMSYKKLMNLEDHCTMMMKEWITWHGIFVMSVINVARLLKTVLKIDDVDETEIVRIIGVIAINSFENVTTNGHKNAAIYDKTSCIEHNCCANCRATSYKDVSNMHRMIVRAVATIQKGSSITIDYIGGFRGTVARRGILRKSKFFYCTCERCRDPKELGTMLSAVKCFEEECTGHMLPSTFLVSDDKEIPDFTCDKCNLITPSSVIAEILLPISTRYSKLDEKNENELTTFIHKQAKVLHENHYHILNAEFKWAILMNENSENVASLSVERLKESVTLCKKLIRLLEILTPANYEARHWILKLLSDNLVELASRYVTGDPAEFTRLIKESNKAMNNHQRLICHEPMDDKDAGIMITTQLMLDGLSFIVDQVPSHCNN